MRKYCCRRTELAISEICTPLANTIWWQSLIFYEEEKYEAFCRVGLCAWFRQQKENRGPVGTFTARFARHCLYLQADMSPSSSQSPRRP